MTKGFHGRLRRAVRQFWSTRGNQSIKQGKTSGVRDTGERSAVTGGRQMDGFVDLIQSLLIENGIKEGEIFCRRDCELPGFFRAEKKWDLLVVRREQLVVGIEFKSHVGPSFGNNFNNRSEEAIGSATDLWTAFREGAYPEGSRPWLGYLMLLEETEGSKRPVSVREPHFSVFREFRHSSYSKRYEILLAKLVRERLFDSCCLLLSNRSNEGDGEYVEPSKSLGFDHFVKSMLAQIISHLSLNP